MLAVRPMLRLTVVASLTLALTIVGIGGPNSLRRPMTAADAGPALPDCCRAGSSCCAKGCCVRQPDKAPTPAQPAPTTEVRPLVLLRIAEQSPCFAAQAMCGRQMQPVDVSCTTEPATLQSLHVRLDS